MPGQSKDTKKSYDYGLRITFFIALYSRANPGETENIQSYLLDEVIPKTEGGTLWGKELHPNVYHYLIYLYCNLEVTKFEKFVNELKGTYKFSEDDKNLLNHFSQISKYNTPYEIKNKNKNGIKQLADAISGYFNSNLSILIDKLESLPLEYFDLLTVFCLTKLKKIIENEQSKTESDKTEIGKACYFIYKMVMHGINTYYYQYDYQIKNHAWMSPDNVYFWLSTAFENGNMLAGLVLAKNKHKNGQLDFDLLKNIINTASSSTDIEYIKLSLDSISLLPNTSSQYPLANTHVVDVSSSREVALSQYFAKLEDVDTLISTVAFGYRNRRRFITFLTNYYRLDKVSENNEEFLIKLTIEEIATYAKQVITKFEETVPSIRAKIALQLFNAAISTVGSEREQLIILAYNIFKEWLETAGVTVPIVPTLKEECLNLFFQFEKEADVAHYLKELIPDLKRAFLQFCESMVNRAINSAGEAATLANIMVNFLAEYVAYKGDENDEINNIIYNFLDKVDENIVIFKGDSKQKLIELANNFSRLDTRHAIPGRKIQQAAKKLEKHYRTMYVFFCGLAKYDKCQDQESKLEELKNLNRKSLESTENIVYFSLLLIDCLWETSRKDPSYKIFDPISWFDNNGKIIFKYLKDVPDEFIFFKNYIWGVLRQMEELDGHDTLYHFAKSMRNFTPRTFGLYYFVAAVRDLTGIITSKAINNLQRIKEEVIFEEDFGRVERIIIADAYLAFIQYHLSDVALDETFQLFEIRLEFMKEWSNQGLLKVITYLLNFLDIMKSELPKFDNPEHQRKNEIFFSFLARKLIDRCEFIESDFHNNRNQPSWVLSEDPRFKLKYQKLSKGIKDAASSDVARESREAEQPVNTNIQPQETLLPSENPEVSAANPNMIVFTSPSAPPDINHTSTMLFTEAKNVELPPPVNPQLLEEEIKSNEEQKIEIQSNQQQADASAPVLQPSAPSDQSNAELVRIESTPSLELLQQLALLRQICGIPQRDQSSAPATSSFFKEVMTERKVTTTTKTLADGTVTTKVKEKINYVTIDSETSLPVKELIKRNTMS